MTTAISGLQGGGLNLPDTVLATAKHFVGDGGAVWGTGNNPGGNAIDRGRRSYDGRGAARDSPGTLP
jgi:beta-glucosidase-like glycosyl hydrolase